MNIKLSAGMAVDIDETISDTVRLYFSELIAEFGIPEGFPAEVTVDEIIAEYQYTWNVPEYNTEEAKAFMERLVNNGTMYLRTRPLPGAVEGMDALEKKGFAGYLTARPYHTIPFTLDWLRTHGFPLASIISRTEEIPHDSANRWKAKILAESFPRVTGIIDDNKGLLQQLPDNYEGTVIIYGTSEIPCTRINAFPAETWEEVINLLE